MLKRISKMMILLGMVFILLLSGCAALAEVVDSGSCGEEAKWRLNSEGVLLIYGSGDMEDNSQYANANMLQPWRSRQDEIKQIVIGPDITSIGPWAFLGCVNATSVTFYSENLMSIGNNAFQACSSLTEVEIPYGVTSIGNRAFAECSSMEIILIPDTVMSIGEHAFMLCESLSSITIPEGITTIGHSTFADSGLRSITIPDSVTTIKEYAFQNCSSLESVAIPAGVTTIGYSAFWGCSSLESITIPGGVATIENWTFRYCSGLKNVELEEGVKTIGNYAFSGCTSLNHLTIPESVEEIGEFAFAGCSGLTDLMVLKGDKTIRWDAFAECSNLSSITILGGDVIIGQRAFRDCGNLTSVHILEGDVEVESGAFYNCSSLSDLTIRAGVKSIGTYAFYNCVNLTDIDIVFSRNIESFASVSENAFYMSGITSAAIHNKEEVIIDGLAFPRKITIYCYESSFIAGWAYGNGHTVVYLDEPENKPQQIKLPDDLAIKKGETYQVEAEMFPVYENVVIYWGSSSPEIVSVDDGLLSAIDIGEAIITASVDDIFDTMTVTVYEPLDSFELPADEFFMTCEETRQLTICDIQPDNATERVSWSSSDLSVLIVSDDGLLTAQMPGDAVITATAENGVTRSCIVHVCDPVTAISFEQDSYTVCDGEQIQLIANVTSNAQSFVNKLVTFTSSDETTASVDEGGVVTALIPGTVEITAEASSGVRAICTVSVVCSTHDEIIIPGVPATCTQSGLTEGKYCGACGNTLIYQKHIPATGHAVRFGQDVYEIHVGEETVPITATVTCGHPVELTFDCVNGLTTVRQEGNAVVVTSDKPGVGTVSFALGDRSPGSAVCGVIIHAKEPLKLPGDLQKIDDQAFTNLTVEEIALGDKVTSIGTSAFARCRNLALINLPDGAQIAEHAFAGCNNLTILCTEGSAGHAYAMEYDIPYFVMPKSE